METVIATWFAVTTIAGMFAGDKELLEQAFNESPFSEKMEVGETVKDYTASELLERRTPVVEGMPWTAPIFNDVAKIVTFPKPHCVLIEKVEKTWAR